MAESASDAAAGYADAVKWIVGLAGAAIAGVFLHPEHITQRTQGVRIYFAVVLFLFGISMIGGVVYLLWINSVRRKKELLVEIDKELSGPVITPDLDRMKALRDKKISVRKKLDTSQGHMNGWFWLLSVPFYLAAFLGVIIFCVWVALPQKGPDVVKKPEPEDRLLRFTVAQSAVHRTKNGMQAHTFLLNQQTGEMWQMICDRQGAVTAFQRVKRVDVKGNPERDEPPKKP